MTSQGFNKGLTDKEIDLFDSGVSFYRHLLDFQKRRKTVLDGGLEEKPLNGHIDRSS